ncbi:G2/M phase-specific E3 ubiquitin-protein ligase isoform X2 [Amphiprion ocellaris]|uniref:G2/M phase-specific E3 ubiquitin-protein ligase isoform X2 n=1 Tax=Amphiprion ocellaris TaxID=80972 RepID=UPI0024110609|nr:G2/M phase-specific E3 ubiquitin-protein ligase isoform X2 [Amphiprion ocellaris]
MKKKTRRSQVDSIKEECCALCRFSDDDPALFGEKVTLKEHKLSVHYFCLLTSCGVYQRGEENEGVFGFLVDDIKQEIRRSARLMCFVCKKKGACVGCNVRSCRKMFHFPCGRKRMSVSQFTGLFPSYCRDHSPVQTLCGGLDLSLPQSCSICLDSMDPVLSFSILKCPSCHASWFHRDCVQHQAHSAGLFFFRCTLCNNKENFQEEMLRMGIYIPERDASWELEANAFSELLEVYNRCDALSCLCEKGRAHSAKSGWFEVIRCRLCGSTGTHRRCSELQVDTRDWACSECTQATDGRASLVASPQGVQRRNLLSKRHLSPIHSPISRKRCNNVTHPSSISTKRPSSPVQAGSPEKLLQVLLPQLRPLSVQVEVRGEEVLSAGLELVRRTDFDPSLVLSVSPRGGDLARQNFLKLLVQQIQNCVVFEGPDGAKTLALNSQAVREDLYFDVGCLLALSLVHGGPPVGFFSPALYQCLFNHPAHQPVTVGHMTPDTPLSRRVVQIAEAESLEELREVMAASCDFLEVAGCNRPISSLEERDALVEDLVNFTVITRMQLPLQRFREGLQTLGVFDQVQLFPAVFFEVFCEASDHLTAQTFGRLFTIAFSEQEEKLNRETAVVAFWRHFLLECEVGRSSVSLQDLLRFSTGVQEVPAVGLRPAPSISFLHSPGLQEEDRMDEGLFPQSHLESRRLLLPVSSSYQNFKSSVEQAVSHQVHLLLPSES